MGLSNTIGWHGTRLTLGDLREIVAAVGTAAPDSTPVQVSVEPTYPHPTDPGGAISITVSP